MIFGLHAVRGENRGDARFVSIVDIREDKILIRGQTEFHLWKFIRDLTQTGFHFAAVHVFHAAHADEQAEKPAAINRLAPIEQIARGRK